MAVQDIRIALSFAGHRKRRKLARLLGRGPGATDYLLDLWLATAANHPDGVLVGMSAGDVADEAGWPGEPQAFVDALKAAGFLDEAGGVYALHDWGEHQGWVVNAGRRSQAAKKAAAARWERPGPGPEAGQDAPENDALGMAKASVEDADGMRGACEGQCGAHAKGNADSETGNAPLPSPSPTLVPVSTASKPGQGKYSASAAPDAGRVYLTRKKKKLQGKRLEWFERFWAAFAWKKGKAEAADAWLEIPELTDALCSRIVAAAALEARRRVELLDKGGTPKWAEGWLRGRRWEDEDLQPSPPDTRAEEQALEKRENNRATARQMDEAQARWDGLSEEGRRYYVDLAICAPGPMARAVARYEADEGARAQLETFARTKFAQGAGYAEPDPKVAAAAREQAEDILAEFRPERAVGG
ncbi:hypothetical protein [Desulfocurvus sp. DL9XJH121]